MDNSTPFDLLGDHDIINIALRIPTNLITFASIVDFGILS